MSFDANTYSKMPHFISRDISLSPQQKILYCEILNLSGRTGYCYATTDELCEAIGVRKESSRNVKHQITELKKKEFIRIENVGNERRIFPLRILNKCMGDENNTLKEFKGDENNTLKNCMGDEKHHPRGDKNNTLGVIKITPLPLTPNKVKEDIKKKEEEGETQACVRPPPIGQLPKIDKGEPIVAPLLPSEPPPSARSVAPLPPQSALAPLLSSPPLFSKFHGSAIGELTQHSYQDLCREYGRELVDRKAERMIEYARTSPEKFKNYKGKVYEKLAVWCEEDKTTIAKRASVVSQVLAAQGVMTQQILPPPFDFEALSELNRSKVDEIINNFPEIKEYVEKMGRFVVITVPGKGRHTLSYSDPGFPSQLDSAMRKCMPNGSWDIGNGITKKCKFAYRR